MLRLLHQPVCPYSRKVRLMLREMELVAELEEIEPWKRDPAFLAVNPAAEVPVLLDDDRAIVDSQVICEYIDETHQDRTLIGRTAPERAEIRRLVFWFDSKFDREVTDLLWREKLLARLKRSGTPSSEAVRAGSANIRHHLQYIGYLFETRRWLAGDDLSLADLTAAAHLSVIDYLGDVPWDENEAAKTWYAKIKSRPSFRPLLMDRIVGFKPPLHYDDLDF